MPVDSGQKFIRRNRAPRVHITYEDPYDAERLIELPFVMGVMADLSGNSPGVEKAKLEERKFLEFDMDNFESRMAAIEPGVTMRVKNTLGDEGGEKLSVNLKFKKMEDFSPAQVARQVGRWQSCWKRGNSWPTCFATWTARWLRKTSSRSFSTTRS